MKSQRKSLISENLGDAWVKQALVRAAKNKEMLMLRWVFGMFLLTGSQAWAKTFISHD
jgi:hypothetical protein